MVFEDRTKQEGPAQLTLAARSKLTVSGVKDVTGFDDASVELDTTVGVLIIRGRELKIQRLSIDGGDLIVTGTVDSLVYEEPRKPRGKLIGKLLG
ncbi:MAG: sporulation protein [Oscillospiraceae bacterium]|jgi:sporulation protein YabP|nr:sporulation protein [Oscillospiraceae bacterium]